jgi:hypothetical protein
MPQRHPGLVVCPGGRGIRRRRPSGYGIRDRISTMNGSPCAAAMRAAGVLWAGVIPF